MPNKTPPLRARRGHVAWRGARLAALALGCVVLAGCQSRTNVAATGNTPAQFTHVFLTLRQVWFNASATALPTDTTWVKFTLGAPATIDLVTLNNGALSQFASELKLPAGTYTQVMLVMADSTEALTAGAQSAGAASNDEVDYVDTADVAHTAPLAILNAAQGISVSTSLTVAATSSTGFGSTSSTTSSTSSSPTASTFSVPVVATTSAIIDFDATRDLIPISLSGQSAFALNPHPQSYDEKHSGSIKGSVSLSAVTALAQSGSPDVQVSAQSLSSDGTRHIIIKTTRVDDSGNFVLYPLSTSSSAASSYDVVIHGPNIETVVIKSVPVVAGAPASATAQLGTLTLSPASPFAVNVSAGSPVTPVTSLVGFYQTLPLSSEVPYLVEVRPVDPISGVFASDQSLSGGSMEYGTYVSGGTISLTAATPAQGASTYTLGAINPAYGTATLGTTVTATGTSSAAAFTVTAAPLPTGSTANTITGTVSVASVGTYDHAQLFLTYNGALVASAPLTSYLSGAQGTLSLAAVAPGGGTDGTYAAGVYNAEVWAWNSANPTGTLKRIPYASSIDLSAGDASGVAINIQ